MTPEAGAARLNAVVDLLENGQLPAGQLHSFLYHDLIQEPLAALENLYRAMGTPLDTQGRDAMQAYLARKPQGKFGKHEYSLNKSQRQLYRRYQDFFGVPDEA
jgi:hypothetical protein